MESGFTIGHIYAIDNSEVTQLKSTSAYPFAECGDKLIRVKKGDGQYKGYVVATFFTVEALIQNLDSGKFYYRLCIRTRFGDETVQIEKEVFGRKRLEELSGYGLSMSSKLVDMLLDYVARQEDQAPIVRQYSRVGWYVFQNQLRFLHYADSDGWQYVGDKDLTPVGIEETSLAVLDDLVKGSTGLTIALCASLSSALVGLLAQTKHIVEPLLVHFFGQSSTGKTSALQLAASCWGNPAMGQGVLSSWHSTENALLAGLSNNFGVACCFDESSVSERNFSSLIYCISQGKEKDRLTKSAERQLAKRFATSILSTGENSLLSSSSNNVGLRVRVLEFFNAPMTRSAEHSNEIKGYVGAHYGEAGPSFAKLLEQYSSEELWGMVCGEKKLFEAKDELILMPITERLSMKYAILLVTAKLVNRHWGFHINKVAMDMFLVEHHNSYREEGDQGERAYKVLLEWVAKNRSRLQDGDSCTLNVSVEGLIKGTMVALLPSTFESLMKVAGFTDIKVIAHVLRERGVLKPEKGQRGIQARVVINGVKTPCYRFELPDLVNIKPLHIIPMSSAHAEDGVINF